MKDILQGKEHWAFLLIFLLMLVAGMGIFNILKLKNNTAGSTTPRWDAGIFQIFEVNNQ